MALSHLARRVGVPALLRAGGPRFSPAAGARHLSSQGQGHNNVFPDIDDILRRSNKRYEETYRLFKMLDEDRRRAVRMLQEELDDFQKIVRRDMQDAATSRKRFLKILDVCCVVSVGAFAASFWSRYLA